jgi:subtilisin family serine protease
MRRLFLLIFSSLILFSPSPAWAAPLKDSFLVRFDRPTFPPGIERVMQSTRTKHLLPLKLKFLQGLTQVEIEPGTDLDAAMELYATLPEVQSVEKIYPISLNKTPNDQYYSLQWALPKMQTHLAWDTHTSSPLTVAIIDSGIDSAHPDFAGVSITKGYDWAENDTNPQDQNGHGTFVAGQIGAATNNNIGVAGVVWNAKLYISKIIDTNGDTSSLLLFNAIDEVLQTNAKIINLSLGGPFPCSQSPSLQSLIDQAKSQGVLVVVAAGNDNDDAAYYSPASCNHVLTVGATTTTDTRATYSNYGTTVDLAAPGGDGSLQSTLIAGLWLNQGYNSVRGTSMAAPHVAGVAAIVWGKYPSLSPATLTTHLQTTADPITTDKFIGKRVNIYKAIITAPATISPYDVDQDGDIDYIDFLILMKYNDFAGIFDYNRFVKAY